MSQFLHEAQRNKKSPMNSRPQGILLVLSHQHIATMISSHEDNPILKSKSKIRQHPMKNKKSFKISIKSPDTPFLPVTIYLQHRWTRPEERSQDAAQHCLGQAGHRLRNGRLSCGFWYGNRAILVWYAGTWWDFIHVYTISYDIIWYQTKLGNITPICSRYNEVVFMGWN